MPVTMPAGIARHSAADRFADLWLSTPLDLNPHCNQLWNRTGDVRTNGCRYGKGSSGSASPESSSEFAGQR